MDPPNAICTNRTSRGLPSALPWQWRVFLISAAQSKSKCSKERCCSIVSWAVIGGGLQNIWGDVVKVLENTPSRDSSVVVAIFFCCCQFFVRLIPNHGFYLLRHRFNLLRHGAISIWDPSPRLKHQRNALPCSRTRAQ